MPETKAHDRKEGNEKVPKKGGKLDKYKWWIIGGMAVIAILVFVFVSRSNANAQQASTSSTPQSGIDPSTGIPYAQEYGGFGVAGGGTGTTGATGPRGPRGGRGPRGHQGKQGHRGKRGPGEHHHKTVRKHRRKTEHNWHQSALAGMAGSTLAGHNNRIIPSAVRRPVPRVG